MKYEDVQVGEWVRPRMSKYKQSCCDCGLVHIFEFRILNHTRGGKHQHIEYRCWRDERATAQIRRWRKKHNLEEN